MSASKRARKAAELKRQKRRKKIALIAVLSCVLVIAGIFTVNALLKNNDGASASEMSQTPNAGDTDNVGDTQPGNVPDSGAGGTDSAGDTQPGNVPGSNAGDTENAGNSQPGNVPVLNAIEPDIDLSELSAMLAYSQAVRITETPNDYLGKVIRANGQYYPSYYEQTKLYYHYVTIGDETLCCQAGLEFVWNGERTYPDDYPDEGTRIEVVGVFGSYVELGKTYYYLAVDDVTILS